MVFCLCVTNHLGEGNGKMKSFEAVDLTSRCRKFVWFMSWNKRYHLASCIYQGLLRTESWGCSWYGLVQWQSMEWWHGWCHTEVKIYPTKYQIDFWEEITKGEGKPPCLWVLQRRLKHATSQIFWIPCVRKGGGMNTGKYVSDSRASTNVFP